MRHRIRYLTLSVAVFAAHTGRAQLPTASQQVESVHNRAELDAAAQSAFATNVPALYEGESSDLGPQSVLMLKPRRTWFEINADEQYFYSDNIFLSEHDRKGADVLVSTLQAALAPTPFAVGEGELAPRISYQHQWFSYDLVHSQTLPAFDLGTGTFRTVGLDVFDFNVSTVSGEVAWRQQNWVFKLGADYTSLLDSGSYDEFYHETTPRWSAVRQFPITRAAGVALGYAGDYRFTDSHFPPVGFTEAFNDHTDHSLFLVGSWQLCRYAVLQPIYRFEYSYYTRLHRDDYLNSFGLTLYCPLNKNLCLRGFFGYDLLNTTGQFAQNYSMLNAGGGLNLFLRF